MQRYCRGSGSASPIGIGHFSLDNALTMIVQDEIQAYRRGANNSIALGQMKWHQLPWPREALAELGAEEVRLRVTLSYLIEPNPSRSTRNSQIATRHCKAPFLCKGD